MTIGGLINQLQKLIGANGITVDTTIKLYDLTDSKELDVEGVYVDDDIIWINGDSL